MEIGVSIEKQSDGIYKVRWWEGGRQRSVTVHGSFELAKKVQRKKLSARDENRHLDIKREVNYRMSTLIDRYWEAYGSKKKSHTREKSVLEGLRQELGTLFVREVDGARITRWFENLTVKRGLSAGTAARHFNVVHHMMEKASTIWSKETGIDRNPADQVEVKRPKDDRSRYLGREELRRLKSVLDEKLYRKGMKTINRTFHRLRLIVLTALTTGMRVSEIFSLSWTDVLYSESLIAVRSRLKGGGFRYVPLSPELAAEFRRFPAVLGDDRVFPPRAGAKGERRRVEGSFETLLSEGEDRRFPLPRPAPHLCELVHDERRGSVRTRKDPRPFQHQNDRAVCQVGAQSHRQDWEYSARDLGTPGGRGAPQYRWLILPFADVSVLCLRLFSMKTSSQ